MPDFAVVFTLAEAPVMVRGDWPLHLTVALFDAASDAASVASAIAAVASSIAPFGITPGPRAAFGPEADVPVTRALPDGPLRQLHLLLVEMVTTHGWRMRDPYWGAQFAPHVTDTPEASFVMPARLDSIDVYENVGSGWMLRSSCPLAAEAAR